MCAAPRVIIGLYYGTNDDPGAVIAITGIKY
jgi:hypothetical protein